LSVISYTQNCYLLNLFFLIFKEINKLTIGFNTATNDPKLEVRNITIEDEYKPGKLNKKFKLANK